MRKLASHLVAAVVGGLSVWFLMDDRRNGQAVEPRESDSAEAGRSLIESETLSNRETRSFEKLKEGMSDRTSSRVIPVDRRALAQLLQRRARLELTIDSQTAEVLQMSEAEISATNAIIAEILSRFQRLEAQMKRPYTDNAGEEWIEVPALGEAGKKIQDTLRHELKGILGDRAEIILAIAREKQAFSEFGDYTRRVSVVERTEKDGATSYLVVTEHLNEAGKRFGGWERPYEHTQRDEFLTVYGHLLEESPRP